MEVILFLAVLFVLIKKIYEFTLNDPKIRNIENPKFRAFLNAGGNNSVFNTFLYFLKRKNYPKEYSEEELKIFKKYKKIIFFLLLLSFIIGTAIFLHIF